jgi:outer membrane protein assembly factor BamE (lipoprotein component of BamABCDE complex)
MKILSTFIIVLILLLLIAVATSGCAIYKTDEITGIGISRSLTINSGTFSDSEVIAHIYSESTQQNTMRS